MGAVNKKRRGSSPRLPLHAFRYGPFYVSVNSFPGCLSGGGQNVIIGLFEIQRHAF
nr:MAG TPA: hypothetical protein [Caudoviricetes sp.]